jgi:hypothetical protein
MKKITNIKMGDPDYEKDYLERKKKLRSLHKRLVETKETQEIYHKIMGSDTEGSEEPSEKPE